MTQNRKSVLRAVEPGESPEPEVLSLDEAIERGSYLQILVAQRKQMVGDLAETKGPALAALHRQISLTSKEIESLQSRSQEDDPVAQVEDGKFNAAAI